MADLRQKQSELPASETAAMEDRVRRYVDRRLNDIVEQLLAKPGFYARFRVELWGFLILFTLAAQWLWQVQQAATRPAAPARPATTQPAAPPANPGSSAAAPPAVSSGAAATAARPGWPEWVRANPNLVKAGLDKLLAEEGVKKGILSDRQRVKAAEFRSDFTVARTANLDTVHLGRLLFEYVAKRAQGEAAGGSIDAAINDSEYPAAGLQRLAAELGVATPAGAATQVKNEEFQRELVMAWLEKNVPR